MVTNSEVAVSERVAPEEHLDPAEVAAYLAGELSPAVRARLEQHLARCGDCVSEVVAIGRMSRPSRRPLAIALGGLAAAAIAAIWLGRAGGPPPQDERGPTGPGTASVAVTQPLDDAVMGDTGSFVWRADPDAITYRLTVTDAAGGEVWSVTTSDTSVTRPAKPRLTAGQSYFWYVDALRKDGHSATSGVHRFRAGL